MQGHKLFAIHHGDTVVVTAVNDEQPHVELRFQMSNAEAQAFARELVGGTPGATNQPTMTNDMLVVVTDEGQVVIGDPTPAGKAVGQFVPVDGDHGIIEFDNDYDPLALREQLVYSQQAHETAMGVIQHLMHSVRWDVENMAALIFGDEDTAVAAIGRLYDMLADDKACELCDCKTMPGESMMDFIVWRVKRRNIAETAKSLAEKFSANQPPQEG